MSTVPTEQILLRRTDTQELRPVTRETARLEIITGELVTPQLLDGFYSARAELPQVLNTLNFKALVTPADAAHIRGLVQSVVDTKASMTEHLAIFDLKDADPAKAVSQMRHLHGPLGLMNSKGENLTRVFDLTGQDQARVNDFVLKMNNMNAVFPAGQLYVATDAGQLAAFQENAMLAIHNRVEARQQLQALQNQPAISGVA
jgi:hypothetical protein